MLPDHASQLYVDHVNIYPPCPGVRFVTRTAENPRMQTITITILPPHVANAHIFMESTLTCRECEP